MDKREASSTKLKNTVLTNFLLSQGAYRALRFNGNKWQSGGAFYEGGDVNKGVLFAPYNLFGLRKNYIFKITR